MELERQLTRQELAVLIDRANPTAAALAQKEIMMDNNIHEALLQHPQRHPIARPEGSEESNELVSSMTSLEKICFKIQCLSRDECLQIARLIRRVRDLLIIHYDMMHDIGGNMSRDFQFCAPRDYAELAGRLNLVGTFLRLHPTRLFSIISQSGQQMTDILFKETMGLSALHENSARELEMRQSSRTGLVHHPSQSQVFSFCHRASVKYLLIVSQLWMCVAQKSTNAVHRQLAWKRIVEFSSRNIETPAIGSAMAPVLALESLRPGLHDFLMNDGIQALIFSWVVNYEPDLDNQHAKILEHLDLDIWRRQSKESILWIMNILLTKLETYSSPDDFDARLLSQKPDEFTHTPLLQHILFTIYSIFGLEPFQFAAPRARISVLFQSLTCRIERNPKQYQDRERFGRLVDKCSRLDAGPLNRYIWLSCDYTSRSSFMESYSCDNERCPHKQRFRQRFSDEKALNEEERDLDEWGRKMKICAGCRMVMYCCKSCQRDGWVGHKTYCLKGREYHLIHEPEQEKLSP